MDSVVASNVSWRKYHGDIHDPDVLVHELCMPALEIVWLHPEYRYSYEADVSGKGRVRLTLRRQLRALNRLTAHWYRRWQAHSLLEKLYGDVVYELDPEGMRIK